MSFYVSTATFFLLHCDEWDRVVALPRHKFVTGATLLQLGLDLPSNVENFENYTFWGITCLINEYRGKISPHYYSNIYSKEHEIAWLSFLLWTRGLHITVPWASSLGVLSWNETSTVTINMFEYDSLFLFYIFKHNN